MGQCKCPSQTSGGPGCASLSTYLWNPPPRPWAGNKGPSASDLQTFQAPRPHELPSPSPGAELFASSLGPLSSLIDVSSLNLSQDAPASVAV